MREGYKEKKIDQSTAYCGEFLCLTKKIDSYSIPFDILIGSVIDRNTQQRFPAEWIFDNSTIRVLKGKTFKEKLEAKILPIEAVETPLPIPDITPPATKIKRAITT